MGSAYYIRLERKIEGLDTGMDGKSISRHIEALDDAARELGVTPLSEFYSIDPENDGGFMEAAGLGDIELPPVTQFAAQDGLRTVQALAMHTVAKSGHVAQDLQNCERILTVAAQHGVGWHFELDV